MKAGSALAHAAHPSTALVTEAVRRALAVAGLDRAGGLLLFLSAPFSRHVPPALAAAAGEAGTLLVAGMIAEGVFNEQEWCMDQAAAAALVIGDGAGFAAPRGNDARLVFAGTAAPPEDWDDSSPRWGLAHPHAPAWQDARPVSPALAQVAPRGCRLHGVLSTGLQILDGGGPVSASRGLDILRIGSLAAAENLRRALPASLRQRSALPVHLIAALPASGGAIPVLAAASDGSLTLGRPLREGEPLRWGLRQPLGAEADMGVQLEALAAACENPVCGLMFSCIGRGPLFYDGDDLDLAAFRRRFPGLPLVGAYGTAQIATPAGVVGVSHNSVATLLFEPQHVQSLPRSSP